MITEDQLVRTTAAEWVATCAKFADQGLSVVDWLTAVDRGHELELLVLLVDPGTERAVMIGCRIASEAPSIASLTQLFPGADWHERETAEMFGIDFIGRESTDPLLLRERTYPPLRKSVPLSERVQTQWPGAEADSGRRRRKLPPGVRAEWMNDEQVNDDE